MSSPKIEEIEKIQSILNTKITHFANLNTAENVVALAEMCKAYTFLEDVRLKNIEQNRLYPLPRYFHAKHHRPHHEYNAP